MPRRAVIILFGIKALFHKIIDHFFEKLFINVLVIYLFAYQLFVQVVYQLV